MIAYSDFEREKIKNISQMAKDTSCLESAMSFLVSTAPYKYSYNTLWLDRPIIQYPQDIIAMQEIIWQVKPDLIIETGIAHGGSIIFSASMLALLDIAEAIETGKDTINPERSDRKVLGIDIEIRPHNRAAIEAHPMFSRIQMIEGSSIAQEIIDHVHEIARQYSRIMVFLDSMHTHDHVLKELELYSPLVTKGSYLVVFDTIIEDMPEDFFPDRPWGKGNNPKTAVWEFLKTTDRFEIDKEIENKLLITVAPDGYLRCIK